MKILILGGTGMLGHRIWSTLSENHEVYATIRGTKESVPNIPRVNLENIVEDVDVMNIEKIRSAIETVKPEVVINCIGIIKQIDSSKNNIISIAINSLLPHQVAAICKDNGARFVHFSTDCVFDGKDGNYTDDAFSNAQDLYGRSKYLGEVSDQPHAITLRTSIIGQDIRPKGSLIGWFLSQEGEIQGFEKAIFSGFPTHTIAKILNDYILPNKDLSGTYNLSADPIDKYDLLNRVKKVFNKDIVINKNTEFIIDRSLNSSKLKSIVGEYKTNWDDIIEDLAVDMDFYKSL